MAQLLLQHADQLRHLSLSVYSKASRPLHQTGSSQTPGTHVSQPQMLSPADRLADPGAGNQAGLDRQGSTSDFWVFNLLDHIFCFIYFNFSKAENFRLLDRSS